jgi:ABC-type multidrug transport system fused ATPase/permease subunit
MVALNWRLSLAAYAILPVIVLVTIYFSRRVRAAFRETRKTIGQVSAELQENIAGVREVQAFAREDATMDDFQAVNERNRAANVEAETLTSVFMPCWMYSARCGSAGSRRGRLLVLGFDPPLSRLALSCRSSPMCALFISQSANWQLVRPVAGRGSGAERIFDLLDMPVTIADAARCYRVAARARQGRVRSRRL